MKKNILLLVITFVFSCSTNEDNINISSFEEPDFLLSKLITHYDNEEVSGEETLSYTYDDNNNPINLNRESPSGEFTQILQFVYDDSEELVEIVLPTESFNGVNTYNKAIIQTLNDSQAIIIVQKFNSDDVLIEPLLYEVRFEFDGYLIKSLLTTPNPDYASGQIYTNFTHDDEGRLLSFTNGTVNFEPIEYQVLAWDDNSTPDNINYFSRSLFELKYWFPKHYISTKNPTDVENINDSFNILVDYESNIINGTITNYIVSDNNPDPDYYDYSEDVSKEYIEAN